MSHDRPPVPTEDDGRVDAPPDGFGRLLRFWRQVFDESQENVAHSLGSSPRHISRLENGHVSPSRVMIEKIARHFGLNDRDTRQLLYAGGFAVKGDLAPTEDERRFIAKGAALTLQAFDPNPAMIFDLLGRIRMFNRSWLGLMQDSLPADEERLTVHMFFDFLFRSVPQEAKPRGWIDSQCGILMLLFQEAVLADDDRLRTMVEDLARVHALPGDWKRRATSVVHIPSLVIPLKIDEDVILFTSFSLAIASRGPATYATRPRTVLLVLLPTRNTAAPARLRRSDLDHPLLAEHFR